MIKLIIFLLLVGTIKAHAAVVEAGVVTQSEVDLKASQASLNATNVNVANKFFLPANVNFLSANKNYILSTYEGLLINSGTSSGDVNLAGAFNGSGAGQKAWIGFTAYNNALLSTLSSLSFTAKNFSEVGATAGAPHGNVYWNIFVNFKTTGAITAADYATLTLDDTIRNRIKFYALSANHTQYLVTSADRMFKCVGGTGKLSGYATSVTGSNVINNVQNADQLTVGMYFRQIPAATVGIDTAVSNIPDGAKITAINTATAAVTLDTNVTTGNSTAIADGTVNTTAGSTTAAQGTTTLWAVNQAITGAGIPVGTYVTAVTGTTSITMSQAATATATSVVFTRQAGFNYVQYGGMAPVSRVGTADGTTVVTGITNTKDLQVGMKVTGAGVPANTFISSIIANTSITLGNTVTTGTPTLSFLAVGKTGIPSNGDNFAIPFAKIAENNSSAVFVNTTPTVAGGWAAADNGAKKDTEHAAISFIQGDSGTTAARTNILKQVTINSDVYNF